MSSDVYYGKSEILQRYGALMNDTEVKFLLDQFEAQSLSDDSAYEKLGAEELGVGAAPADLVRAGKRAFDNAWDTVKVSICASDIVKKSATNQNAIDSGTVAALISSASGAVMWSSVNIALVAYIAARVGVRILCTPLWETENEE